MEFEEKVEKKSQWPFDSMTVDGKKEFLKKIMFSNEKGNVIISSCIICFASARKYSEEMLWRLKSSRVLSFTEWF